MSPDPETKVDEPVDIILLAYNRLAHLERMVDSIEARTRYPYRLTIVDNGSDADTRSWLHEHAARFHRIIFNDRNEHLAGLQRGIQVTSSERYVVSDADLLVPELPDGGCWLAELNALMDRHADFGMIGCRIEGLPMPEWHDIERPDTKIVDGELIEGATGVWLNMIRRSALRVPFESDGMTCHALARAGFRVGVGVRLKCDHLGDEDPVRYPDYLARKNAANGFRSVYVEYPELRDVPRPPTLAECALAAPVLEELEKAGVNLHGAVELLPHDGKPAVSAVDPRVVAVSLGSGDPSAAGIATKAGAAPWADRSVEAAIVVTPDRFRPTLLSEALRIATHHVVLLSPAQLIEEPTEFKRREVRPPNDAVLALARWGDRSRIVRRQVGYTTLERKDDWLEVFRASRFAGRDLRMYVMSRSGGEVPDLAAAESLRCSRCRAKPEPTCSCRMTRARIGRRTYRPPLRRNLFGTFGAMGTQVVRALAVELRIRRSR